MNHVLNGRRLVWMAAGIFVFGMTVARAAEITARQAETAVAHWLQRDAVPMGTAVGRTVVDSAVHTDDTGSPLYHVVRLHEGGFVVTPTDDNIFPIVVFSENGEVAQDEHNPLWDVLKLDMAQRKAQPFRQAAAAGSPGSAAAAAWAALLDEGSVRDMQGTASISDVRIAPLMQSKWGQKTAADGVSTYNRFTPNNHPCGCVATVGAQIMRYHEWPTASVPQKIFHCNVDGTGVSYTLFGGVYAWQNMPFVPGSTTTGAQRDTISTVTRDMGVAVHMRYTASNSGTHTPLLAAAFTGTFGYANAHAISDYEAGVDQHLPGAVLANLDAGCPVGLSITGSSGGHAVVADGYGFSGGLLYVHLNMGWSGNDDVWYNLPVFDTTYYSFSLLRGIVFNVFPELASVEIISGRITDAVGSPLAGVAVSAQRISDGAVAAPTASGANGIYSLTVPSPANGAQKAWRVVAASGSAATTQTVEIAASASTRYTFNEVAGTYSDPPGDGTVGNRWGVDFMFSAWPVITTTALPAATIGVPYSAALSAAGGHPPYRWDIIGHGALPAGLSLSGAGIISGTPTVTGTYNIEFRVFNSNDDYHTSQLLTLTVHNADAWTYDPVARTLRHSSTPWVLNVSPSGNRLTISSVQTPASTLCPLPLRDPITGGYSIVAIANNAFQGDGTSAPGRNISSLTLPDSLASIGGNAFYQCGNLVSEVTIPDGVTSIGNYAFAHCGIKNLTLGCNVANIGTYAFYMCSNLNGTLIIPDSVTYIGGNAFIASKLTVLVVGNGLDLTGNFNMGLFSNCQNLTSVSLTQGLSSLGTTMFRSCTSLRSIIIPDSVTAIGTLAFERCTQLTHVEYEGDIPVLFKGAYDVINLYDGAQNVTSYVRRAHAANWQPHVSGNLLVDTAVWQGRPIRIIDPPPPALYTVTFDPQGGTPPSPSSISVSTGMAYGVLPVSTRAEYLFQGWWTNPVGGTRVESHTIVAETVNHTLYARWEPVPTDSWTYDPAAHTLSHNRYGWVLLTFADGTGLTIADVISTPSGLAPLPLEHPVEDSYQITAIADWAFFLVMRDGVAVTDGLTFPAGLTDIGEAAFYGCGTITGPLCLPDSVTNIARNAFSMCSGLDGPLILPPNLNDIHDGTFEGCTGFTGHLAIPQQVESIGNEAFMLCQGLGSVYIPPQVSAVARSAFVGCENLTALVFGGSYSAAFTPHYWGMNAVTTYVYAAHADSWNPHVEDAPVESGNAFWQGRPIRLAEEMGTTFFKPIPIPYAWLFRHGNLAPDGDFDAAIWRDPDEDGMATWEEYIAGTDPLDAASIFRILISRDLDIHWWPDLLDERVYTVEGTESLTNPTWGAQDENSRFFRVKVDFPFP